MIECVNGNGQGCCLICVHLKGWHREWSSSLYYVKNKNGLYLRRFASGDSFSDDDAYPKAAFCYRHALMVEDTRKTQTDWNAL